MYKGSPKKRYVSWTRSCEHSFRKFPMLSSIRIMCFYMATLVQDLIGLLVMYHTCRSDIVYLSSIKSAVKKNRREKEVWDQAWILAICIFIGDEGTSDMEN